MTRKRPIALVLSCEHAGNRVPARYAPMFRGREKLIESHRGWDPGALDLARALARTLGVPLISTSVTRLLVEPNRSPHHPALFSAITRRLPASERRLIFDRYYTPHRDDVTALIEEHIDRGECVVHVGVHTFTPILDAQTRRADVGLLYDPQRMQERNLCGRWARWMSTLDHKLRIRRNYPYRGAADGLTTSLRRRFPAAAYLGIELEVNQALATSPETGVRRTLRRTLTESLQCTLCGP